MYQLIVSIIQAILAALFAPLRWLGWQPAPRAADVAAAALSEVREQDRQVEPQPAPDLDGPLPLPQFHAPLGHMIKDHAKRMLRDEYALSQPAPDPLPTDVDRWLLRMDDAQLRHLVRLPAWMIQEHVLTGAKGSLHSLGYCLPQPAPARIQGYGGGDDKGGRGGKGGGPVNLQQVLDQLGYAPAAGPRMR
ncbi:hypothetical protein [Methylobacterium pseudosasicola]|uniref:Uncharacterized protein n=1 Tax=Methylobacterium pseudosasicola TaxID=582667 RepID=A0A1I4U783_9HYPH|nr:hypothetical protein [Methylobacterium pseudosasicola]SFM84700.1 hypothetical protein SAMN05192568_10646 [Methylobacterium pseudosasicola]